MEKKKKLIYITSSNIDRVNLVKKKYGLSFTTAVNMILTDDDNIKL